MKRLIHDDNCGEFLDPGGKCPRCGFWPDMQSTALVEVDQRPAGSHMTKEERVPLRALCDAAAAARAADPEGASKGILIPELNALLALGHGARDALPRLLDALDEAEREIERLRSTSGGEAPQPGEVWEDSQDGERVEILRRIDQDHLFCLFWCQVADPDEDGMAVSREVGPPRWHRVRSATCPAP